jgi:hypothetical protein
MTKSLTRGYDISCHIGLKYCVGPASERPDVYDGCRFVEGNICYLQRFFSDRAFVFFRPFLRICSRKYSNIFLIRQSTENIAHRYTFFSVFFSV